MNNQSFDFMPNELYYRNIHNTIPELYNDKAYLHFGHIFVTNPSSPEGYYGNLFEINNRLYINPLAEKSFFPMYNDMNVVFTRHPRYVPSRFHSHQYIEIVYQCSGSSVHNIDGKELVARTGDIFIISPGIYHSLVSADDYSTAINIILKGSCFKDKYTEILEFGNSFSTFFSDIISGKKTYSFLSVKSGEDSCLKDIIMSAFSLQEKSSFEKHLSMFLEYSVKQFFAYLSMNSNFPCTLTTRNKHNETIISIISYIKDNYADISLESLSETFHFTVPYLSRMIKSETGHTFSEIICSIRMNRSLLMLENTELPVSEISASVGYRAPENYMRTFKSIFGITPTEYRKKYGNKK